MTDETEVRWYVFTADPYTINCLVSAIPDCDATSVKCDDGVTRDMWEVPDEEFIKRLRAKKESILDAYSRILNEPASKDAELSNLSQVTVNRPIISSAKKLVKKLDRLIKRKEKLEKMNKKRKR